MSGLHDEGHTVAGWAGCAIATAGAVVAGMGICGRHPGIWMGLALMVPAPLVTWALHLAGWGKAPGARPAGEWGLTVRDRAARQGHPDCLGCRLAGRRGAPAAAGAAPEPVATAPRVRTVGLTDHRARQ
ncbi:HGxxPAAW family protein [Streptomyces sp. NPDC046931]|uniref:HGxxPAAW family protein n=1 Tax=Streptomyces sp. NPDC046931 TaxID=3154806 RepID=UPI0033E540B8